MRFYSTHESVQDTLEVSTVATDVTEYLKYAVLQMASEALSNRYLLTSEDGLAAALVSRQNGERVFSPKQANQFLAKGWRVLAYASTTESGFSGTLFKNARSRELVVSVHTRKSALRPGPYAKQPSELSLGQIIDMESWYCGLKIKFSAEFEACRGGHAICCSRRSEYLLRAFKAFRHDDATAANVTGYYTYDGAVREQSQAIEPPKSQRQPTGAHGTEPQFCLAQERGSDLLSQPKKSDKTIARYVLSASHDRQNMPQGHEQ